MKKIGGEKMDEWDIKCKMETLIEAEEIKKNPELMKAIDKMAKKKVKAIKSIADLEAREAEID